jgi:hypothetical protein
MPYPKYLEPEVRSRPAQWLLLGLIALMACVPAFAKPLTIDDAAYIQYARHILHDPANPYGFDIFWTQEPESAHKVLAPALVPYWWALGIHLFGDSELLWRIWFLPFLGLAGWSLFELSRRFGTPPVLTTISFLWSPLFVPQVNFMLDVPALALGLAAMVVFTRDRAARRWRASALAGLLIGLAMLAKYSAVGMAAAIAVYALVCRRRDFVACLLVAAAVVVSWEGWLYLSTGQSHWWWHWTQAAHQRGVVSGQTVHHAWAWLVFIGGGLPLTGLLVLPGRRHAARLAMGVAVSTIALAQWLHPERHGLEALFALAGCCLIGAAISGVIQGTARSAEDKFLLAWLALETINAVVPVPFMAMRRCLAPAVPALLLILRNAPLAREALQPGARRALTGLVSAGCALGLAAGWADYQFAAAQRDAVAHVHHELSRLTSKVWFTGHWGWQHYAEAAGWHALDAKRATPHPGDLVVQVLNVDSQAVPAEMRQSFQLLATYETSDYLPLRVQNWTVGAAYHGGPGLPYVFSLAPHLQIWVWRVSTIDPALGECYGRLEG